MLGHPSAPSSTPPNHRSADSQVGSSAGCIEELAMCAGHTKLRPASVTSEKAPARLSASNRFYLCSTKGTPRGLLLRFWGLVRLPGRTLLLRRLHSLERLNKVFDAILLRKRLAEEAFYCRIEKRRVVVRNRMRRVREYAKLAVGNVVVDFERVLVSDQIVIAGQHKRGSGDRLQRCGVDMRLIE